MNYLLDTNLVVIYLRDNAISRKLEADLNLLSGEHSLIISVVSVGELKSIAKRNKWGERKIQNLVDTLADFLIADINVQNILDKYAEIDAFSQGKLEGKTVSFSSRNMSKNDLWIAATASVYDIELITTDKDFVHLENEYLKLKMVDLANYK